MPWAMTGSIGEAMRWITENLWTELMNEASKMPEKYLPAQMAFEINEAVGGHREGGDREVQPE
jgi:hypothetical protein